MAIIFPDGFPTNEQMFSTLHKTIEKSWRSDIDLTRINQWLDNFKGKVYDSESERRLALWLLCNFTYYSSDDINHLCRILYNKFLHDLIIREGVTVSEVENLLKSVSFSSVGSASESGGLILYHFRQEANLTLDRFFYPTDMPYDENSILVYVDDSTLGGGTCLRHFYKNIEGKPNKHIYYLTIMASEEAVKKLEEKGIIVIYCSLLDGRNKCFGENSVIFHRFPELRECCKKMAEDYGLEIIDSPVKPLGYNNGEFCFGFYYNTPNNSLPIFWSIKNWVPIFTRKEKLQNAKQLHISDRKYI